MERLVLSPRPGEINLTEEVMILREDQIDQIESFTLDQEPPRDVSHRISVDGRGRTGTAWK